MSLEKIFIQERTTPVMSGGSMTLMYQPRQCSLVIDGTDAAGRKRIGVVFVPHGAWIRLRTGQDVNIPKLLEDHEQRKKVPRSD